MKLYQSYIGNSQRSHLADVCIPCDASHNTGNDTREYELFREIHARENGGAAWGLISWKFKHKTSVSVSDFKAFCEDRLTAGYDCAFINPMIGNEAFFRNVWIQGEYCHSGMKHIAQYLQKHAGINTEERMGTESFSFCNFFVGTRIFWGAYLSFVDKALAELEAQGEAGTRVGNIFTGYGQYTRDPNVSMRAFVIERLFSSFVIMHPEVRCASFPHSKDIYTKKFGDKLGMLLYRLSLVKNHALATDDTRLRKLWNETVTDKSISSHLSNILIMDDPHELYLDAQHEKLSGYASRLGLEK